MNHFHHERLEVYRTSLAFVLPSDRVVRISRREKERAGAGAGIGEEPIE
jgi:hypothetical protein